MAQRSRGKVRYAQVGIGGRSFMYTNAIVGKHKRQCQLVALCDINQGRMDLRNKWIAEQGGKPVATYIGGDFDRMIAQTRPDVVIVTTLDAMHSTYICRAMELGCDAITEKPMTTDETKCRGIFETVRRTGRSCRVTFNYRYAPHRSQVKEILDSGAIGRVLSVDFTWPLDTRHGADYFRRWHRHRGNSGSLLVHKATHHFDLVNWWLGDAPTEVFCHASREFYTPANAAEQYGLTNRSHRCLDCAEKTRCRFYMDLPGSDARQMYLDNEAEDGYFRDRCVFGPEIDIWDSMSVSVKYRRGAILNYFLLAYSPWEGYQIAFNGTKGRLEHGSRQYSYISGADDSTPGQVQKTGTYITLHPHVGEPQSFEVRKGQGGHGGGDPLLLDDLFNPNPAPDPLGRKADHRDGTRSILVGVAAYHSIDSGRAISTAELLGEEL